MPDPAYPEAAGSAILACTRCRTVTRCGAPGSVAVQADPAAAREGVDLRQGVRGDAVLE